MKIFPFQAHYPNQKFISSPDSFFSTVKYNFLDYFKAGFFEKSSVDALYIYKVTTKKNEFTGLIASTDIMDFKNGNVLKHENTIAEKQQHMMHLLLQRNAMIKPVLLAYENKKEIDVLIKSIISKTQIHHQVQFEEKNEKHQFWKVNSGKEVEKIKHIFKHKVPHCFIADGHHRTSTTIQLYNSKKYRNGRGDKQTMLCAFFPFSDLIIHDFNRVITGVENIGISKLIVNLSNLCTIKTLNSGIKPTVKFEFTMFIENQWFLLNWKKKVVEEHSNLNILLDAELINQYILTKLFKIKDIRKSDKITYIEGKKGVRGIEKSVNSDPKNKIGFMLYPVQKEELISISKLNKTLPPKSTFFEPRVINGLIVESFS